MRIFAMAAAIAAITTTAHAATVSSGATSVSNDGGITLDGAGTTVSSYHRAYNSTDIGADWVWDTHVSDVNSASFTFIFDLSGFDAATAVLSGLWGVDNIGSILLNGVEIASMTDVVISNFSLNHSYGTSDSSLFYEGLNTVNYLAEDRGGQAAFRATVLVEADALVPDQLSEVPLPAGGFLLLSGLGLLVLRRRYG